MPRPVKWSRDLHSLRERATRSRTETWSRRDVEDLFGVGRATAQTLMKAIGEVQSVGAAHFVDRASLLSFLDSMLAAPLVDEALRERVLDADRPPAPRALRVPLPAGLRNVMRRDLPENILLSPGRLEITADSAAGILEGLVVLAQAMQNDLEQVRAALEIRPPEASDAELQTLFKSLRRPRQPSKRATLDDPSLLFRGE